MVERAARESSLPLSAASNPMPPIDFTSGAAVDRPALRFPDLAPRSVDPTLADHEGVLRLCVNENPYGMSTSAQQSAREEFAKAHLYPDSYVFRLRDALASFWECSPDNVVVGNGMDEIVLTLCLALSRGAVGETRPSVLLSGQTYPVHRASALVAGCDVIEVPLRSLRPDSEQLARTMQLHKPGLAIICDPHNPTGYVLTDEEVELLVAASSASKTILVFDHAYAEYETSRYQRFRSRGFAERPNVLMMRTFSKIYGLAGLRCGYAIGARQVINELSKVKNALVFSVNRVALTAAVSALADQAFVRECEKRNSQARTDIVTGLRDFGDVPTAQRGGNFVLFSGLESGLITHAKFVRVGVSVKELSGFGLANYVRISIPRQEDVSLFLSLVQAALA